MGRSILRKTFPFIIIVLIASFFRLVDLNNIPSAISGDELLYAITAKSVFLSGHDLSGTWNPLSAFAFRYPPNEQQAELPYILHLLTNSPFPFSLFAAKLPFAMLSIGIVVLLYLIAAELFGEQVGLVTGLMAAVNPWLVVMGRTAYETTPATFFYLLGLYLLLKLRSWKILWSMLPFLLAFYSYIATKLIVVPFVVLASYLSYRKQKNASSTPYLMLCVLSLALVVIYIILLKTNPTGSRLSDILLPSSPAISTQVDALRKNSLASPLVPMMVNKYTVYTETIIAKLFRIFSPEYLFVQGDQFFLPINQSFFYYIDGIFMILGALALFSKKRTYAVGVFLFIFIGALPHVFHKNISDFSDHLALMFPFLVILVGVGIADVASSASKRLRAVVLACIAFLYICNIAGFVSGYFFQYPLTGSKDFPMRVLSNYIRLARSYGEPVAVYSTRSGDFLKKYLFYTDGMNAQTMPAIKAIDTRQPFTFHGIHFTDCDVSAPAPPQGTVAMYDATCGMKRTDTNVAHISSLTDGGILYTIIHDPLCDHKTLHAYPTGITLADLSVEKLTPSQFCTIYISQ